MSFFSKSQNSLLHVFFILLSLIHITPMIFQNVAADGESGCECLTTSPVISSKYKVQKNGVDTVEVVTANQNYYYDPSYGVGCKLHDNDKPPHCADLSALDKFPQVGQPFTYAGTGESCGTFGRPKWCEKTWCWVDPNKCTDAFQSAPSSYFPGAAYYSYKTCGSENSFLAFTGAQETITLVENYMRTIKCQMESDIVGSTKTCPSGGVPDLCGCQNSVAPKTGFDTCKKLTGNTPWTTEKVQLKLTGGFNRGMSTGFEQQKCVEDAIAAHYQKIVELEYNMGTKNLGYLYSGQQERGDFVQWPLIEWCSNDYDPRFRPWYSIVASGPKDVVIVIDKSGSMHKSSGAKSRMELAKEAAIAVLKTLTWIDMVSVIAFDKDVITATGTPIPATSDNLAKIKSWISHIDDGGTTNFGALKTGMRYLVDARKKKGCWSSYCASAMLFLTDGKPDQGTWSKSILNDMKAMNKECDDCVRIFTYALGAGADVSTTQEIASAFSGTAQVIADGNHLKNAMSKYYESLVVERDTSLVRWVRYSDAMTGTILLAGCTAIDDKSKGVGDRLWGVVCMDANMAIDLNQLAAMKGYADFVNEYESKSRTCEREKFGFNGQSAMQIYDDLNCDENDWSSNKLVCSPGQNCIDLGNSAAYAVSGQYTVLLFSLISSVFFSILVL